MSAQLLGKQAEMERLESQANELIANGDPNGAALAIGKAAMMAGILAKQESGNTMQSIFDGAESLFRMQENGYRAIALFEQAGGQTPAPTGSCQLLSLANHHNTTAHEFFSNINGPTESQSVDLGKRYTPISQEWMEILQELKADFGCR